MWWSEVYKHSTYHKQMHKCRTNQITHKESYVFIIFLSPNGETSIFGVLETLAGPGLGDFQVV